MTNAKDALVLDLLEWITAKPRTYNDVMEAWRTSCPRLTIWEDATERGLVARDYHAGVGPTVSVTAVGRALLSKERPLP